MPTPPPLPAVPALSGPYGEQVRADDVHVVGQTAEAAQLDALLDLAAAGARVVAVIEGPTGIGKTTLLHRFLQRHPEPQVRQIIGLPWESRRPGALALRLLEEGAEGPRPDPAELDPADLGTALAQQWEICAERSPLLVVVDDAHCSDQMSLQAVASAVARLRNAGVLLLLAWATGWPATGDPGAVDVLDRLAAVRVRVPPLGPDETRLLAARVAMIDLPRPVARRLCEHTGGRPGQLLEILHGTPPTMWSDWQTRLPAPGTVQRRVQRALDGCSPAARALVESAAVLGPAPVLAEAATLAGLANPVAALDEASAAGLLVASAGRALTFPDRSVRDALHDALPPGRRHALHLAAADVVADEMERLRHRVQASPLPDDGLADELVDLARRKSADGAWAVVASALIDASRISPRRDDREDRLIQAVDALAGAGLLNEAVDALPEVEALPASVRRDAVLAHVAIQRGRRAEAVGYLDAAWHARGPDRRAAAVVCQRRVLHALADWNGDELVRWAGRAVEHAEPGSPPAVESHAIVGLGHAAQGQVDRAFTAYRRALVESPAGPQHQRARMGLGWLHLAQDDPQTARRELESAVPTLRQTGSSRVSLWALVWLARTQVALGDWSEALHSVDQAEVVLAASGLDLLRPLVHWTGAQVRALRGELDAAERHLRLGGAAEHAYTVMIVPALLARALVAEATGDTPAVLRHLTPLVERADRDGLDEPGFWPWQDTYATALVLTDRLSDADHFLTPLEAAASRRGHRSTTARLGAVRGRLLAARGEHAAAEQAFIRARAQLATLPLPYDKARVDFAHGLMLRRAGRRRDAAELLACARQSFAALDAQVYVKLCDRELKTSRSVPRGPEVDIGTLTEQERAVSALVAKGMTNKEVAATMMLSVKTVQFHLTRVYGKLGVRSRSELAARAAREPDQR